MALGGVSEPCSLASRLASLTLIGAAGIHVKDVAQVDPFLTGDEQRIRDLFYDQDFAEAVIASSERPEMEDAILKNRTMTARLAWQPRNHDPQLRKWLHRIKLPALETVEEIYEMATEDGHENLDYAATLTLLEKWAGVEVKGASA